MNKFNVGDIVKDTCSGFVGIVEKKVFTPGLINRAEYYIVNVGGDRKKFFSDFLRPATPNELRKFNGFEPVEQKNNQKFKVGDVVKIINPESIHYNKIGTIIEHYMSSEGTGYESKIKIEEAYCGYTTVQNDKNLSLTTYIDFEEQDTQEESDKPDLCQIYVEFVNGKAVTFDNVIIEDFRTSDRNFNQFKVFRESGNTEEVTLNISNILYTAVHKYEGENTNERNDIFR